MTRWSIHAVMMSKNGMIQKSPGPRRPRYLPRRRTTARSHCCAIFGACASTRPTTMPVMIPCGLRCAALTRNPATNTTRKTTSAMMFPRAPRRFGDGATAGSFDFLFLGMSGLLLVRSRLERLDVLHDLVERDPDRRRVGEEPVDERSQLARAIASRGESNRRGIVADESADASLRGEHASAFELSVDFRDGVGVDAQVDGELPHGREAIAGAQAPGGDRGANATIELGIQRGRIERIDGEHPSLYCASRLVQVKSGTHNAE